MRSIITAALVVAFSICAFAQDQPQPNAAPAPVASAKPDTKKEAPAEVTIPASDAQKLENAALKARNAQLEADTLEARIKEAVETLKKQREEAKNLAADSDNAFQKAAIKAGIPGDNVREYSGTLQPDGSLKLVRKPPLSAPAAAPPK